MSHHEPVTAGRCDDSDGLVQQEARRGRLARIEAGHVQSVRVKSLQHRPVHRVALLQCTHIVSAV